MITTTNASPTGLHPEATVLFACARPTLGPAQTEQMRALVQGPFDWDALIDQAERHRVLPLLGRHFDTQLRDLIPAPARDRAERLLRAKVAQAFLLTEELRRLLVHLQQARIKVLAYKGPALAQQIYGDIALRSFGDLDLLIRRSDWGQALRSLAQLGYHPSGALTATQQAVVWHSECDQVLRNERTGAVVELHWAVAPPHLSFALPTEDLFARCIDVNLLGTMVAVPSREDLLLLLAMNGAKDLWQRLEPACLIAGLCSQPVIDWAHVLRLTRQVRGERMLRLALAIAIRLLGAQPPAAVLHWLPDDPAVPALLAQVTARLAAHPPRPPDLRETTWFRVRSREHWADGMRHCVLRALLPTVHDCLLPVPAALWPAVALVRPFRLLAQRLAPAKR